MKLSATVISQPLVDAINNSISKGIFLNNVKVAFASPADKKLNNKNKVSSFRPVSVLIFFLKYMNLL